VLIFVTHSTSTDNEAGIASGHRDVGLSDLGRRQAAQMRFDVDAVYCSDLRRAVETAEIAFGTFTADARLREQDYGERTGAPSNEVEAERPRTVDTAFPGGESLRDVAARAEAFLDDLPDSGTILVIGHRAIKLAFDHLLAGMSLADAARAPYEWKPSWTYRVRGDG
jgi:broad specificity phosphatase PhoE